ncbi:flagellin [Vibrio sp.]|nr:flagellin [Vibrio sp.]
MAVNVNTNVPAMTAQRYLNSANEAQQTSMERLSSGNRINSAKDDAAGLQISNRLNVQSRGLDVAVRNANDGISMAQTAEGAMNESTNILQRMRDLSLQSSNGSNSKADRVAIQEEVVALNDELNRVAETTSFGSDRLLNGTFETRSFQIGADSGEAVHLSLDSLRSDETTMGGASYSGAAVQDGWEVQSGVNDTLTIDYANSAGTAQPQISITLKEGDNIEEVATYINGQTDVVQASVDEDGALQLFASNNHSDDLGAASFTFGGSATTADAQDSVGTNLGNLAIGAATATTVNDVDVRSVGGAQEAVAIIDSALKFVDSHRAELGAFQNRMDHATNNLDNINENVNASKSRIKDTDFAKETTELTKQQILGNASSSILAQAKQSPQAALGLLG